VIGLLLGAVWPFAILMFISLISACYVNLRPPRNRDKYRKEGVNHLQ